jgi:formylglycine-generating enzyme required for sulfatase activity
MTAEEAKEFQARYAKARGLPVEVQNRAGMTMVLIPPGEISVPKLANRTALRVSRTEVTLAEFRFFVKLTKHVPDSTRNGTGTVAERKPDGSGFLLRQRNGVTWEVPGVPVENSDTSPVTQISWNDAVAFCAWLSSLDGHTYRLPTMEEHEWFARAGVRSPAYYGQTLEEYDRHELSNRSGEIRPGPVGSRRANAWGLCDTRGNVGEWLRNVKPDNAVFRAVANGTFLERPPQDFRNSWWFEKACAAHIGFRVVTEVPP